MPSRCRRFQPPADYVNPLVRSLGEDAAWGGSRGACRVRLAAFDTHAGEGGSRGDGLAEVSGDSRGVGMANFECQISNDE